MAQGMTQDADQTAYIRYTAPTEKQSLAKIDYVIDQSSCPSWQPPTIDYYHYCQFTLKAASDMQHCKSPGDDFEIHAVSFWGMVEKGSGNWEMASGVARTFGKGEKGEVHFDPSLIGCGGTYQPYINVTNVQGDNVEFTVGNNNDSNYVSRIDFEITLMDNTGGTATHNNRYTGRDPEIQLEKKN